MRTAITALALLLAGACGGGARTAPAPRPQTVRVRDAEGGVVGEVTRTDSPWAATTTLDFPIDAVWAALPAAYDSLGMKVTQLDPASRTIGCPALRPRRQLGRAMLHEYLDCGRTQGDLGADSYDIRLSVLTRLQPGQQPGTTTLHTTVEATAKPMGVAGNWVECSSQGRLESRLVQELEAVLGAGS